MPENNIDEKEIIANICEELYKYCISQIPQVEKNIIIWIKNGSIKSLISLITKSILSY